MKLLKLLFKNFSHLSRYMVWLADCFLSVVATLLSYLFFNYLIHIDIVPGFVWIVLLFSAIATLLWTWAFKTNIGIIRHATVAELAPIAYAMTFKVLSLLILAYIFLEYVGLFVYSILILDFALSVLLLLLMRVFVVSFYYYVISANTEKAQNALIYGTSNAAVSLANYLRKNKAYKMVGFVTRNEQMKNYRAAGYPIYYFDTTESFDKIVKKTNALNLFYVNNKDLHSDEDIISYGLKHNVCLRIAPMAEMPENVADVQIRSVQIEDLLGRDVINIDFDKIRTNFADKTVLVTGAAGSIGSEICRQLCQCDLKQLIVLDFSETATYQIDLELRQQHPNVKTVSVIADVRNQSRMEYVMKSYRPDVVFHAAAYKHVPLMEEYPCEAVIDNVMGTRVVADLAVKYDVSKFIMISTDKAVHPSSVMGATKRLAEMYVQSLGESIKEGKIAGKTTFVTTRFGNVLGSNGSVIPLFRKQILEGGPVTVTDPNIIRYFMTIPEACRLVMEAAYLGEGNDIFIFDMGEPVKIVDLARRMIELSGLRPDIDIQIVYSGLRPGEKLYEELLYKKENTVPTANKKIYRALVGASDYDTIKTSFDRLIEVAKTEDKVATVRMMKSLNSDYRSLHSRYVELDK
ncbi:MAG: polysaccharide biosynthesis protein [Phocaeicola sp.]|nr:polysaccharide biosynthesis protein [Phocaeicola sp.]